MFSDDIFEDGARPLSAKRQRVGIPATKLLEPIEDEVKISGRPRHLRAMMLHAGQPRGSEPVAEALKNQSDDLGFGFASDPGLSLGIIFESVLSLPAAVPNIAAIIALASRRRPELAVAVVSTLSGLLGAALTVGNMLQVRLLLRLVATLGATGTIMPDTVVAQLSALLEAAASARASGAHNEATAIVYAVLSALPFFANIAGSKGESVGAGNAAVADSLSSLLESAGSLVEALSPAPGGAASGVTSLTVARQRDLGGWLDVPQSRMDASLLEPLAQTPVQRLWGAVQDALGASAAAAEGATSSSRFCRLAPATVARLQDDPDVAGMLFDPLPQKQEATPAAAPAPAADAPEAGSDVAIEVALAGAAAEASAPAPAPSLPLAFTPVVRSSASDGDSGSSDAPGGSGGAYYSAPGKAPAPLPKGMQPVPTPEGRWFVRPSLTLFGPGGLTNTIAVMKTLQLGGASPLDIWGVREVAHDVIATYAPFSEATAQALLHLPMGRCAPTPGSTVIPQDLDTRPLHAQPLVVEAALTQMLWAPSPPFTPLYYCNLVLDLLKVAPPRPATRGDPSPPPPPPTVSSVLSIATRALFKYAHLLDDGVLATLSAWTAFHASHLRWQWMWADMAPSLGPGVHPSDPQRRFARGTLERAFALIGPWYYDKAVPTAFKPLADAVTAAGGTGAGDVIPPRVTEAAVSRLLTRPPAPAAVPPPAAADAPAAAGPSDGSAGIASGLVDHEMKGDEADALRATAPGAVTSHSTGAGDAADDAAGADAAAPAPTATAPDGVPAYLSTFAAGLMGQIRAKAEAAALNAWIDGNCFIGGAGGSEAGDSEEGATLTGEEVLLALTHCVLVYGAANFKHAATVFDRYRPLLASSEGLDPRGAATPDDVRAHVILSGLEQVWAPAPHMIDSLAGLLVDARIATPAQVASFALAPAVAWPPALYSGSRVAAPAPLDPHSESVLPGSPALSRLAQPRSWGLLHSALARAEAASERGAVQLAMFRGDKVLDGKEQELTEESWAGEEGKLVATARATAAARDGGVAAAITSAVRCCRALEAHVWHLSSPASSGGAGSGSAPQDTPDAAREVLRVSLSQLRSMLRSYRRYWQGASTAPAAPGGAFTREQWEAALLAAGEASTGLLAHSREFAASAGHGGEPRNPEADLAGILLHVARTAPPVPRLEVAPALLRDSSHVKPSADF